MKGLPELVIGDLKVKRPVIQGGMGVGVSLGQLAGAVAKAGGVGIISTAQIGFREPDFETNTRAANIRAIGSEFQRARETAPDGVIGFNIMVALKDYDEHVKAAVDAGADLIVSGAGLPIELPGLVESSSTKIAPIVSTEKSAKVILKYWDKKFSRTADLVVIEGPKAGGHLGSTAKFPRNSFAFKWADEMRETKLVDMEWSPSRTGLINPVAIFEPVELEGTTVSRASVHNISIVKELQLGIGDTIKVYKANMIIPQIAENLTRSGNLVIPDKCPVCGREARIRKENDVETLYCMNPDCVAKKIKSFSLFTSRDAMNIDGLSEATLEKFIAMGFIHNFGDIFEIGKYKDQIVEMEGFGQKSFDNLMVSLEKAKKTTLAKVIYSLGITGIGLANAKVICKYFDDDIEKIRHADEEEISSIEGIGPVIAGSLADYFKSAENNQKLDHLLSHLHLVHEETSAEQVFAGKTFVITGSVEHFSNRSEAKEFIEARGGKVTGSVTKKTDYLINNDKTSASSKNKKAQELGIPILSEEDFLELAGI